ncbi:M23 family metallopeptidase [Streptomyces sp. SID13666]|uniref:M23 family metallopeptidase n=1 Tax=Streptomyces TaxID=1883 RepID=UPI001106CADF|nr:MULTISPECIES: M23 family metallopeptidase [Streptomyces]MCZ4101121.1 M23 family metallopeptidase [Streptomyces sp. H39-C1]NEA58797.1 M23 family metallopeptidase [Streptomyces sp. SID13666]NEA74574.1 M23 family metallopeptidase [Streptomyces sp. SID13588]QNA74631.1 M23 family metallopeptidase [Streptomyces sp. So13.3]
MLKNSTKNHAPKSVMRGRAAVVAGGVCVALALGSTAAMAADSQDAGLFGTASANSIADVMKTQADVQKKAAAASAKAAAAKADAKKRAAVKSAADRSARQNAWVKPVTSYTIGASFAQAGSHWSHKHSGQDFVVPTGTQVRAVHGGTVVEAGWGGAYGNNIVIKHGNGTYTQYGHLSKLEVSVGQTVSTSQEIGKSGSTGNSTGPHLHFEARTTPVYGSGMEPLSFLHQHGVNM